MTTLDNSAQLALPFDQRHDVQPPVGDRVADAIEKGRAAAQRAMTASTTVEDPRELSHEGSEVIDGEQQRHTTDRGSTRETAGFYGNNRNPDGTPRASTAREEAVDAANRLRGGVTAGEIALTAVITARKALDDKAARRKI